MWADKTLLKLSDKKTYCRDDLFHLFLSEKPDLSDGTFRWILYNLLQEQKLFKIDYDTYVKTKPQVLPTYKPYYSDKAKALTKQLTEQFSQMRFVIFESVLLNEFLNHQIAQNTIYLQIEKDISSYIFDTFKKNMREMSYISLGKKTLTDIGRETVLWYWL